MDVRTVNEHIKNVYKTEELDEKSTIRKFRIVQIEGNREVEREINHYNLDMILAVGYRVNSKKATTFRQWATKTLREHITKGYTINRKRIGQNYDAFIKAVGGGAGFVAGACYSRSKRGRLCIKKKTARRS